MEVISKKFKIGKDTFYLRKCNRAFIEFEEITGKTLGEMTNSIIDSLILIYACVKAGMKYENIEFIITLDEFIDSVDGILPELTQLMLDNTEKK